MRLTANPGISSPITARSHTFIEMDHEIISKVILRFPLFQEGLFKPLVDWAAVCSKAVVLLLLIYYFMYLPLFVGVLSWSLLWYELVHVVFFSFTIILTRNRELVAFKLLLLSFGCLVTVNVLYRFLMVPWVGL